jgi:hypothetical protein
VNGPTNVNVVTAMKAVIVHAVDNGPGVPATVELTVGNFPTTHGIDFPATGDPFPPGKGTNASYQWVQIMTGLEGNFLFQPGSQTWDLCSTQQVPPPAGCANISRFLDTGYPFSSGQNADDSPGTPLPHFDLVSESETAESFNARMWLMWDPALKFDKSDCAPATAARGSGCDSIPIPLGYVDWHWSGCAINTLDTVTAPTSTQGWRAGAPPGMPGCGNPNKPLGGGDPTLSPGPAFNPQGFVFPEWDTVISGDDLFKKPKMTCKGELCPQ